jgi:hypothetical protein
MFEWLSPPEPAVLRKSPSTVTCLAVTEQRGLNLKAQMRTAFKLYLGSRLFGGSDESQEPSHWKPHTSHHFVGAFWDPQASKASVPRVAK